MCSLKLEFEQKLVTQYLLYENIAIDYTIVVIVCKIAITIMNVHFTT